LGVPLHSANPQGHPTFTQGRAIAQLAIRSALVS